MGPSFVVYTVDAALGADAPVKRGDELVSIDGVTAKELAGRFRKYVSIANPLAAAHTVAARLTSRPIFASQGLTPGAPATVRFRSADGSERDVPFTWAEIAHTLVPRPPVPAVGETNPQNAMAVSEAALETTTAELSKMGSRVPFFMTAEGRASLGGATEIKPSAAAIAKFELTQEAADAVGYFATTYRVGSRKVLLVRLPDYTPASAGAALDYLRALFDEQRDLVDALVLDQTHNPGGSVPFAGGVLSLLAKAPFRALVQAPHADRRWISSFASTANSIRQADAADPLAAVFEDRARQVDDAYGAGKTLGPPFPFTDVTPMSQPDPSHWTKPVVMLADELSVSCADIVPLIARTNGMATLFGQTTMGGGGNVERVATLVNTGGALSISRGVGTVYDPTGAYPEANVIEDNGVTPDIVYSHTLSDFRAGYVGYIRAFNAAVEQAIASAGSGGSR